MAEEKPITPSLVASRWRSTCRWLRRSAAIVLQCVYSRIESRCHTESGNGKRVFIFVSGYIVACVSYPCRGRGMWSIPDELYLCVIARSPRYLYLQCKSRRRCGKRLKTERRPRGICGAILVRGVALLSTELHLVST